MAHSRLYYNGPDELINHDVETLLIRNIPRSFRAEELLEELDCLVGDACYNFVAMPWDHKRNANIGYGFVNFRSTEAATECFCRLSGHIWRGHPEVGACRVATAHVQGLPWNLARHMFSKTHSAECVQNEPLIFDENGVKLDLHQAVRRYCTKQMLDEARCVYNRASDPSKLKCYQGQAFETTGVAAPASYMNATMIANECVTSEETLFSHQWQDLKIPEPHSVPMPWSMLGMLPKTVG